MKRGKKPVTGHFMGQTQGKELRQITTAKVLSQFGLCKQAQRIQQPDAQQAELGIGYTVLSLISEGRF
jgi:hypothetical protein